MDLEKIKEEFAKHYNKYDIDENAIKRKFLHSLRVMELAREIAITEKFNENDVEIATIAGLLHDYARFQQWTEYKTYSDKDSVDHGDLANDLLFTNKEIEKFYDNKDNYDEISDSIKYHNKKLIPDNLSEHNRLICKVIRDADKLDIYYQLACVFDKIDEDDCGISEEIIKEFYENKILDYSDIKNKSDNILLILAMIYDINFIGSLKTIESNNYLWKIFDKLNNKEKFRKYFEYIDNYIKERMI